MNEEEVGAPPLAAGHGRGGAPLSYKRPHDLEIGKRTTTSTTSSYSLTKLVVFEGKFSMDVYPPVACI